ncbi:MAG: transcriptional repressor [Clostridia bacterium]|nr:transcriptional repressor [Clostridia bacterium]
MVNNTKHSKQRDALIEILQSTDTHPTAEWVYEKMREIFPNVSLATVYRNLKHMIEIGMAREIYTDNSSRFDANMTEHYHFLCRKCNKLIDIFPEGVSSEVKEMKKLGFEIDRYDLSVYGVCKDCKEADAV